MKTRLRKALEPLVSFALLPVILTSALVLRLGSSVPKSRGVRVVWGSTPIINNSYWARALAKSGIKSQTYVTTVYGINKRGDWDLVLTDRFPMFPDRMKPYVAFIESLFRFDVFIISFDGFFIGGTSIWRFQAIALKVARKKIIVIPYGSDAYVYRNVRSLETLQGLLSSYPGASRMQGQISSRVEYWTRHADFVVCGTMGFDGIGRWDILTPSPLCLDLRKFKESARKPSADGVRGTVVIVHCPNHRGFKGTEFVVDAVRTLQSEGLNVELKLLEGKPNEMVIRELSEHCDILVEQVLYYGHGLNALEGMAVGIPTVSNLEDPSLELYRRFSFFGECPLVSANVETLTSTLRSLVTTPQLRIELGKAGRAYVEKYHGEDSAQYLFLNIIDYLYGQKGSIFNLYHPIVGEYPNRLPKIHTSLVKNRIVF